MPHSVRSVFVSIGSNQNPEIHIFAGLCLLNRSFEINGISSVYETPPYGPSGKQNFWNLAVELKTEITSKELELRLNRIETRLDRKRNPHDKFAPRTIDLDILPFKGYEKQAHVMIPLAEIAPETVDPYSGKSFEQLAGGLKRKAKSFREICRYGRLD